MDKMREVLINRMIDNLPTLRKKANITQTELAEMIGVSKFTILSIEKRQRRMTWNTSYNKVVVIRVPLQGLYAIL